MEGQFQHINFYFIKKQKHNISGFLKKNFTKKVLRKKNKKSALVTSLRHPEFEGSVV